MTPGLPRPPELTVLVATAGYGKTTALDAQRPRDGVVCAARDALADGLPDVSWVGLDDLHDLTAADQRRLLADVAGRQRDVGVTLASRRPLAPDVRRALRGPVRERGPLDLALDPYAVHRVLADDYGVPDPEVPVTVHALTAGWPALVHLAADALSRRPGGDLRPALAVAAAGWVRADVLPELPAGSRRLLTGMAGLGAITPAVVGRLAGALGLCPDEWSLDDLLTTGIVTPLRGIGRDGLVEVVPVVADVLSSVEDEPDRSGLLAAAEALELAGLPSAAARARARLGDRPGVLRLLAEHGDVMVRRGDAAGVVALVEAGPAGPLPDDVRLTYADALRVRGALSAADRAFRPLVAAADARTDTDGTGWTPALASRVAAVRHAGGAVEAALDVLARAPEPADPAAGGAGDVTETVEWMSARAHVLCSLGRRDEAAAVADAALRLAESTDLPTAWAAAHLAMARVTTGEHQRAHYDQALRAATDAGDVVVAARGWLNLSSLLLASARYVEAATAARSALQAADAGIATGRRPAAMHNLAEALAQQGSYDEAGWHLQRATAACRGLGAGESALGLLGLAEIDRQLGHDQRARARYLEAIDLARSQQQTQLLVQALAGLARVDASTGGDAAGRLDQAQAAVDEALRVAAPALRPFALTAAGRVALRRGDRTAAADLARRSVATAREVQAFDLLADALELAAACADEPQAARAMLAEALAIWTEGGAGPPARRVELQLGWLDDADGTERSRARDAARALQRLGVRHVHGRAVSAGSGVSVHVAVLGGFDVQVDGAEVPLPAWRSRQARTLVKLLAARRGRPATRAWLRETLWPDDDPSRTGHRLSVLLATVRGVLDPERRWPTDRYVAADATGVWLDLRTVTLDADTLVRDAEHAARLMDAGSTERAAEILADVDARYRGDAFEDEPGEEWADALREEVRAAWQRSARRLAALRRRAGRVGDAQNLLVRLLAADPYDEKIHQLLVRSLLGAGRHGEARRAFDRWTTAMHDIGVPPPDPARLGAVVTPY